MDPGLYALIEPVAFTVPVSPGATPVYQPFAPLAMMKMVDYAFEKNKNYFLSYSNINQACFRMLDDSVPIQFKVSNIPNLTGWNASMSIQEILTQLEIFAFGAFADKTMALYTMTSRGNSRSCHWMAVSVSLFCIITNQIASYRHPLWV
jgi:hypothetical protein